MPKGDMDLTEDRQEAERDASQQTRLSNTEQLRNARSLGDRPYSFFPSIPLLTITYSVLVSLPWLLSQMPRVCRHPFSWRLVRVCKGEDIPSAALPRQPCVRYLRVHVTRRSNALRRPRMIQVLLQRRPHRGATTAIHRRERERTNGKRQEAVGDETGRWSGEQVPASQLGRAMWRRCARRRPKMLSMEKDDRMTRQLSQSPAPSGSGKRRLYSYGVVIQRVTSAIKRPPARTSHP